MSTLYKIWTYTPKTLSQFIVFWIFVHACIGTRYLNRGHPYKDKSFSLQEIVDGQYLGRTTTMVLGSIFWMQIIALVGYVYIWLS